MPDNAIHNVQSPAEIEEMYSLKQGTVTQTLRRNRAKYEGIHYRQIDDRSWIVSASWARQRWGKSSTK